MWSPWRSQHIESFKSSHGRPESPPQDGRTLFERLAQDERDADNLVLWRGEAVFVVMNLYPYNNGHLLVVPYRPVVDYEQLTDAEQVEMARTVGRCLGWLRTALAPEGFNVGMNLGAAGGAGVPEHLHQHVVPRWRGDTNFMPVTADVKVVPEALRDTYRKLRAAVEGPAPPASG